MAGEADRAFARRLNERIALYEDPASVGTVRSIGHTPAIAGEADCAVNRADFCPGVSHHDPVIEAIDTSHETASIAGDVDRAISCMDDSAICQQNTSGSKVEVGTTYGLIELAVAGDRDRAGLRADVAAVHEHTIR